MTDSTLYFKQLEIGPMANFIYVIGDPRTHEAAVIDPAWDVDRILGVVQQDDYLIKHVLVTHGHPDHVNGVEDILSRTGARLRMHKDEVSWMPGWKATNTPTQQGDRLRVGNIEIKCLHTPGHTPGSQCFMVGSRLIAGDTLFINSCGRTDLPGGDPEQLYESLTNCLMKLDDSTVLFPGHNYADEKSGFLKDQKRSNPFLGCASLRDFLNLVGPSVGPY